MKYYYLIEKKRSSAFGINPWIPHEVFTKKKSAISRCQELNAKANRNEYAILKVLNGDFVEHPYED